MTMPTPGQFTQQEILSQPEAWAAALDVLRAQTTPFQSFFTAGQYRALVFTGCGSTYYLALAAAALWQGLTGLPTRGLPASEIWLAPHATYVANRKALLIAVSRSGETTETLRACETFRAAGGEVLTISCYPGRPLTALGHFNLVLPSGQEESVAQTRAFTTLYLATVMLAAIAGNKPALAQELWQLPAAGRRVLDQAGPLARQWGASPALDRFYFLGSGLRYGLACELSLKMKEMSLSHSEPFHFMEFRHGPKSMVTPGTLIVGLVGAEAQAHELAVLADMRALGAQVLAIGEHGPDVAFAAQLSEPARQVLYLPVGQQLAFAHALFKGLDPDRPHNLDSVVKLG